MAVQPSWNPTPDEAARELAALDACIAGQRVIAGALTVTPHAEALAGDAAALLARQEKHRADVRAYCAQRGIPTPPPEA